MKKLLAILVIIFSSLVCAQPYTLIDSVMKTNDSLRARILELEAYTPKLDTTIVIDLKNITDDDSLFLFIATKNVTVTSLTSAKLHELGVEEVYFKVYYGDALWTADTTLGNQTYLAGDDDYTNYYITTHNTITKNQYVWFKVTAVTLTDPMIPAGAHLIFKINYTRN